MLIHFNLNLCGVQKMNDNVTALKLTIEEAKIHTIVHVLWPKH